MRTVHRIAIAAFAVVATLATTGTGVFAAGNGQVTREQFVYDLDRAIGLQPVMPTTPDFTDVSPSNPYYGYIEAAYQKGYIQGLGNGLFGPTDFLTRAQMAKIEVTALGDTSAAQALMSQRSKFTDDAAIPSWARGYVLEASQLGLVRGYPNGKFVPGADITTSDESAFIQQFVSVLNGGTGTGPTTAAQVDVTASPSSAAVGQMVQLSAAVKTAGGTTVPGAAVSYTTSDANVILSGSQFIASAPGVYTIQASYDGITGLATINVYGLPVAIKLVPSGPVVADGQSTVTMQADVVDQNGNIVRNAQGNIALFYTATGGATSIVSASGVDVTPTNVTAAVQEGTTAPVVQGIATFSLRSGLAPGLTDSLEAAMYSGSGTVLSSPTDAQTTLSSIQEAATSLSVQAPQYLSANVSAQTLVKVQVLDQAGAPMLFASVPLSVSIAGPAAFGNGSTGQQGYLYSGSGDPTTPGAVKVPIQSIQGKTGQITLTVSATGLQSQTAQISSVIAGPPAALQVTSPSTTSFSESAATTGLTFGVAVVDAHGYPVSTNQTIEIRVDHNGAVANDIRIDGYTQSNSGVLDNGALAAGSFTVTGTASGANAGTYTIYASDPTAAVQAATPVTFTETPGPVAKAAVSAPQYVPLTNPTVTIQATLEDLYGNVVPVTGTVVNFVSAPGNQFPGVTLSSATATTQDGVASVQATLPVYVGKSYTVDVSGGGMATQPVTMSVVNTVAGSLTVAFTDMYQGGDSSGQYAYQHSKTTAQASDTVQIVIAAVDQYGQPVTNQLNSTVDIQFSNTGLVPQFSTGGALTPIGTNEWSTTLTSQGTVTISAIAETAGTVGVTATDTSIATSLSGSGDFTILPGRLWGYDVLDGSGNNVTTTYESVQASSPVELYVTPVDEYGNPTVTSTAATVSLSDGSAGGTFSLSPGGASISGFQMQPGQSQQIVYYENPRAGNYHIFAN